jgi:hypothetical protein
LFKIANYRSGRDVRAPFGGNPTLLEVFSRCRIFPGLNKPERLAAIRYRSFIRNSVLAFALSISWSCHKKATVSAPVPAKSSDVAKVNAAPSAITPAAIAASRPVPLEPAPLDKTIITTSSFDLGEMNFQIGNYNQAAKFYQTFLNAFPKAKDRDRALYHMGLACALDSNRDLHQTEAAFKKLVSEFPSSPYKGEAEFILNQQAQIEKLRLEVKDREEKVKRLSEELQKLKDIDMQRRPTRSE